MEELVNFVFGMGPPFLLASFVAAQESENCFCVARELRMVFTFLNRMKK